MTDAERLKTYDYGDEARWPDPRLSSELAALKGDEEKLRTEVEKVSGLLQIYGEALRICELKVGEIERVFGIRVDYRARLKGEGS